jgi:hypothetical protein
MTSVRTITVLLLFGIGGVTVPLWAEEAAVNQYFPLALGNRWIYELHDRTDAPPALESWEVVREERGTFVLRIGQSELTTGGFEEFFIPTSAGIKRFARETQNKDDPPFFLKEPLTVGTTWDDEDGTYEITALDKTVSAPAGTFPHCLEVTNRRKGGKATVVTLYAPGVGVVQREEVFPIIEGSGSFYPQRQDKAMLRLREWKLSTTEPTALSPAGASTGGNADLASP